MSGLQEQTRNQCISCGINVAGSNAAQFDCPECGHQVYRCAKCRKQSNLYQCPDCGFTGP
ncbi:HVO_2753 family zinc finger protein [Halovenus salina]|uniref:HVO_2753 family zinc finger protein n=1 Tax=Halovenus salina TaxID=1510225 RepID=A0ABD5VXJ3_9EURY|nr:HVO_2753 family zinc finger protein [Halovenus salina]